MAGLAPGTCSAPPAVLVSIQYSITLPCQTPNSDRHCRGTNAICIFSPCWENPHPSVLGVGSRSHSSVLLHQQSPSSSQPQGHAPSVGRQNPAPALSVPLGPWHSDTRCPMGHRRCPAPGLPPSGTAPAPALPHLLRAHQQRQGCPASQALSQAGISTLHCRAPGGTNPELFIEDEEEQHHQDDGEEDE